MQKGWLEAVTSIHACWPRLGTAGPASPNICIARTWHFSRTAQAKREEVVRLQVLLGADQVARRVLQRLVAELEGTPRNAEGLRAPRPSYMTAASVSMPSNRISLRG